MASPFIDFIKAITCVPEEQEKKFRVLVSEKHIKKEDNFIRTGEYPKTIGFVKEGLFRYYYTNDEGIEFTKGFFVENTVISSYSAILENRGSYFTIEALEDSVIEQVNYNQFNALFSEHPCWNEFLLPVIQKGYIVKEEREREFLLYDAERRYRAFLKKYPGLERRIKKQIIASYLGITPESLSRIRNKMGLLS
jgi:CRP-like cAMP-binding protein